MKFDFKKILSTAASVAVTVVVKLATDKMQENTIRTIVKDEMSKEEPTQKEG